MMMSLSIGDVTHLTRALCMPLLLLLGLLQSHPLALSSKTLLRCRPRRLLPLAYSLVWTPQLHQWLPPQSHPLVLVLVAVLRSLFVSSSSQLVSL